MVLVFYDKTFLFFRRRKSNQPDDSMAPAPLVESPGEKIKFIHNDCKLLIYYKVNTPVQLFINLKEVVLSDLICNIN